MTSKLVEHDRIAIAHALYDAKFPPSWSTDGSDFTIAGYGELNNEFEYPLYLIDGVVQDWTDVRGWLKTEEAMANAIDVITGDIEDVKDGGYILIESCEIFKAYASTFTNKISHVTTEVFEFISPDGTQQLQTDDGYTCLILSDWFTYFAADSVLVCDVDDV